VCIICKAHDWRRLHETRCRRAVSGSRLFGTLRTPQPAYYFCRHRSTGPVLRMKRVRISPFVRTYSLCRRGRMCATRCPSRRRKTKRRTAPSRCVLWDADSSQMPCLVPRMSAGRQPPSHACCNSPRPACSALYLHPLPPRLALSLSHIATPSPRPGSPCCVQLPVWCPAGSAGTPCVCVDLCLPGLDVC
jgi:hypothetical protein